MKKSTKFFNKFIDHAVENPKDYPDKILMINFETFQKILTPERMNIIRTIKEIKPKTIGDLAVHLGMPEKSVLKDFQVLKNYGLLKIIDDKKPRIEMEAILIHLE